MFLVSSSLNISFIKMRDRLLGETVPILIISELTRSYHRYSSKQAEETKLVEVLRACAPKHQLYDVRGAKDEDLSILCKFGRSCISYLVLEKVGYGEIERIISYWFCAIEFLHLCLLNLLHFSSNRTIYQSSKF